MAGVNMMWALPPEVGSKMAKFSGWTAWTVCWFVHLGGKWIPIGFESSDAKVQQITAPMAALGNFLVIDDDRLRR